jgi:TolB protein
MAPRRPYEFALAALLLVPASAQEAPAPPAEPAVPLSHAVCAYATWSPDGRTLVYQSSAAGNFDLYAMRGDGSGVRLLEASPRDDITPVFSPDGHKLLFVSEREGNREIYVLPAEGGAATNLSRDAGSDIHPVWSADGQRILFSSNRSKLHDDDFDIFEMQADGGGVRQITRGPEVDTYASWSPDGRRIVTRRVLDGNSEVFVLDADGGKPLNLTQAPEHYDGWPCWSPDGSLIAYAGGGPDTGNKYLFLVAPDGSQRRQLTFAPGAGAFRYDTQPAFSPDGRFLVFTRYAEPMPFERAELFLLRLPEA